MFSPVLNSFFSSHFKVLSDIFLITLQGSCPAVPSVPPASQCSGRVSDCWSVGQADADCINNAFCCFDGCANVCQGAGQTYSQNQILTQQ